MLYAFVRRPVKLPEKIQGEIRRFERKPFVGKLVPTFMQKQSHSNSENYRKVAGSIAEGLLLHFFNCFWLGLKLYIIFTQKSR